MNKIIISDSGKVEVPTNVQMRDFEIAELLGVMVPTVKGKIKTLLENRHFYDCAYNIVSGNSLIPEYFGLEMVIAVAFSIDSYEADVFRKWVMQRVLRLNSAPLFLRLSNENQIFN